jgi:hypothetical protein
MIMRLLASAARVGLGFSAKRAATAALRERYTITEEPAASPGSPRVIVMHDYQTGMEAAVAPSEGGELSSLRIRFPVLPAELLYRAREYGPEPGFRGKAALSWPTIGQSFAQDLPWREVKHSIGAEGARLMLELRDSEETRLSYPFGFVIRAAYELADGRLSITYTVSAASENSVPMPFSIGSQLAFRLPFLERTEPNVMRFQTHCTRQMLAGDGGGVSEEQCERSFATAARLGDFDATMALAGYQGIPSALLVDPQGLALRIRHRASTTLPEPLVQFSVFGGPSQGFLCLAPRFGMQNSVAAGKGPVMLRPGGDWQWTIELSPEIAGAVALTLPEESSS